MTTINEKITSALLLKNKEIKIKKERPKRVNQFGYKGVKFLHNRYEAQIKINGKNIYLGRFKTAEEAGKAYYEAKKAKYLIKYKNKTLQM